MNLSPIWSKVLRDDETIIYEFSISPLYLVWMVAISFVGIIIFGLIGASIVHAITVVMGDVGVPFGITSAISIGFICTLLTALVLFYYGFYVRIAHAYALTNSRLIIHRGWLWTQATSIEYNDITDVEVQEGFFEKLFTQSGSLFVNTAGTDSNEVRLHHIAHPYEVRKKIDAVRDDLRPTKPPGV